ncbi:MAG: transposase [Paracoccaceae bacterium]|nr:transposase [Paracoccaceae bacterium]MDE2911840.1 transposase [Paracoccaceae bacterium]
MTSDRLVFPAPDTRTPKARARRCQMQLARQKCGSRTRERRRHRLARMTRRVAKKRQDWRHKTCRALAGKAGMVAIEDLNTAGMTGSAKGTPEAPGRNVRQNAGLNRLILEIG